MAHLWFYYALSASVIWGISYAFTDRLLQQGVSISLLMLIEAALILPTAVALSIKLSPFKGVDVIFSNPRVFLMAVFVALTAVAGGALILLSITEKNATLASFIEISYPLFVFIFSMIFFKDVQLNMGTALGACLIMAGIATIYFKG
ncbi:MAG: EamA family transporter [Micavibrio aeruginosavorus]|uniref:EamA family transporter n=1 Tax=Micavibrio aeruginosavorus TaxID=349221 RepID=A0A7T5R123_9BACT|nr:MAG: EamA family transporter [Micavibrio aeruginosavorus]